MGAVQRWVSRRGREIEGLLRDKPKTANWDKDLRFRRSRFDVGVDSPSGELRGDKFTRRKSPGVLGGSLILERFGARPRGMLRCDELLQGKGL